MTGEYIVVDYIIVATNLVVHSSTYSQELRLSTSIDFAKPSSRLQ